jgi:hypothetical protein
MGYYAAVMQFTPVGVPDAAGRWEIGGTLGYIPDLPLEDRTVGFGGTKTEGSNLCTVFPHLVASRTFGRLGLEAGWTPPLQVCGVQAHIGAVAASWRLASSHAWDVRVRGSAVFGSLEAPITCTAAATENPDDLTCFGGHLSPATSAGAAPCRAR